MAWRVHKIRGVSGVMHRALAVVGAWTLVTILGVTGAFAIPADCTAASSTCFRPNVVITGANPPDPFPWLTVELEQVGTDVLMAMRAGFADSSYIGNVWMNIANAAWLSALTFDQFAVNAGSLTAPSITKSSDNVSPTPGEAGQFDLVFLFSDASAQRFNAADEFQLRVTCPGCVGFGVNAFDALSTGGDDGAFRIAAHVQGFGSSSKVGGQAALASVQQIPFPTTLLLLGAGLIFVPVRSRNVARG